MMRGLRRTALAAAAALALLAGSPARADKTEENRPDFPTGRNSDLRDDIRGIFGFGPRTPPGNPGFRASPTPNAVTQPNAVTPTYNRPTPITRQGTTRRAATPMATGAPDARCAQSDLDEASLLELQRLLNYIWGSEAEGAGRPDGRCGQKTVSAVTALQRAHGRDADGVPSRATLQLAREVVTGAPADGATPAGAIGP